MGQAIALLINDLHISRDTIPEFNANWDEAIGICKDMGIQDIFIGGDVFTSRASQTLDVLLAVKNAYQRASALGIDITVAEGNHDKVDQESVFGYNSIFDTMRNVIVVDTYAVSEYNNCLLAIMSYFPENGSFTDKLNSLKEVLKKDISNTVLYIHEGIHGALGDFDIPGELPQDLFTDFKEVLVGHYHNRVHIKGTNIQYIGSSRQNNFGEDEEKGYTVLFDDGSTKFLKNNVNVRYITIETDIDHVDDYLKEKLNHFSQATPAYKIKVKVKCADTDVKTFDKQSLIDSGASKIEMVTEKLQKIEAQSKSIDEKFDKNGIKKEYSSFCEVKGIDSEIGMKYLDMI